MNDIQAGGPPEDLQKTPARDEIKPLIEKAMADPGVWYNIEMDEEAAAAIRSSLVYNVAKSVSEWSIRGNRVYFRFK